MKSYYVYIVSSKPNGTLYIGFTSDLIKRTHQHKNKIMDGFTSKYNVGRLVYFEEGASAEDAILREKELKRWRRARKISLIESKNPFWKDLYPDILGSCSNESEYP